MSNYCVYIPDELFSQFLDITGNDRNLTKGLWGLASSPIIQKRLGLKKGFTATEFLDKIGQTQNLDDFLNRESMLNYINQTEDTENSVFDTMDQALGEVQRLRDEYRSITPLIQESKDGFTVKVFEMNDYNERQRFTQQQLGKLNNQLVNYIERLGFTVGNLEGLGKPGMFSSLKAIENANGLKQVIHVAKGYQGELVMPEEISHLLVEGFQNNVFMQRLMNVMDEGTIIDILGDQYQQYYDEYNGDQTLLKKEAVARLVAQHLVDRNGIGDQIRFISDKMLDKMRNNLRNGSESDIDAFLKELDDNVKSFVSDVLDMEDVEMFDYDAVINCQYELDHLNEKTSNLQEMAESSYNIMAKRVKLKQLKAKDQKMSKNDLVEFTKMDRLMKQNEYTQACIKFLNYAGNDCQTILDELTTLKQDYKDGLVNGLPQLKRMFRIVTQAQTVVQAYSDTIQKLSSIEYLGDVVEQIDEQYIEEITELAKEANQILNSIDNIRKEINLHGMAKLYQNYWSGDKEYTINGRKTFVTLENVLRENIGDTSVFTRLVNSLSDSRDPLLQMVDMLMKDASNNRDSKIFALQQKLAGLLNNYVRDTGSRDMKFLLEQDDNGRVTGMFKSDRSYRRYHEAKNRYIAELKQKGLKGPQLTVKVKQWELDNTEMVNVAPNDSKYKRMERMPKKELFPDNPYEGMNDAQKKLYDEIIELKKSIDMLLPKNKTHLYRAPQKKISVKDELVQTRNAKGVLKRIKDSFVKDVKDDVDYGDEESIDQYVNGQHVILDFSGKEVKKIPIFYTTWLDDMSTLDINIIDTMLQYGAMAFNYDTMSDIADFMEATNSLMQDRKIVQTNGARKLVERFKPTKDIAIQGDYSIQGAFSESAKQLRNYIDRNVYGVRKKRETIIIAGKEFELGKIGDNLKNYSSIIGLGYNIFSGTTNLTMGMTQTMLEAAGNSLTRSGIFGLKDIIKANKLYNSNLMQVVAEQYTDRKKNKLSLLIQKFDCMEEYYQQLNDTNYYGGIFKKMVGKHNPLILNSMGEHYLHTTSMLAALNKIKVKVAKVDEDGNIIKDSNGNIVYGDTISLYDAFEIRQNKVDGVTDNIEYSSIDIPRDKDGNSRLIQVQKDGEGNETTSVFGDDEMFNLKLRIQQTNHKMHGAFNDVDRGDIHRNVLGRMVMQFRQWMPAFYTSRFGKQRINVITGETEEGFYNTYYKFLVGTILDLRHLKSGIATRWSALSNTQKVNVWKGLIESSLALMLTMILRGGMGKPDKEDPGIVNLIKYNMYRLKMELVAATPGSLGFIDNIETLVKSPIPAMENIDRLLNLLDITSAWETVQSGKYAGWNKYVRNLYYATPYVKNVGKFIDMMTEGDISMFNPYTKSK